MAMPPIESVGKAVVRLSKWLYNVSMLTLAARVRNVEEAHECEVMGFNCMEITLPCPGGPGEEQALGRLAEEKSLIYLGHGPNEGDPRNLPGLTRDYWPRLIQALESAARLHCRLLTVHSWLDARYISEDVIRHKVKKLANIVEKGIEWGVAVNLENLSEDWRDLSPVLQIIPGLGITLDVGHAQLLHSDNTAPLIIKKLYSRIRHLHVHDNFGGNSPKDDLHLTPGEGVVPFDRIFRMLKEQGYHGTATLEVGVQDLLEARDWVHRVWDRSIGSSKPLSCGKPSA